jgi:hypothetical protein
MGRWIRTIQSQIGAGAAPVPPCPWGTSPVGSPRLKADGSPLRYGDLRAVQYLFESILFSMGDKRIKVFQNLSIEEKI